MGKGTRAAPAVALALFAGTLWLFWPATRGAFVWDDAQYVVGNAALRDGLTPASVRWAFTSFYAANWHPLAWLSHLADVQLHGLDPRGHHLTSVLLHAANALLLFVVLRRLTGALWRSALVAALFAVHPLRVESVAWVAERKDVLCALFALATIGAYVSWARRPTAWRRAGVVALFALALLAKPMAVTLPLLLLLLDAWPLHRTDWAWSGRWRGLVAEKAPLFVLSGLSAAVTLWAQAEAGGLVSTAKYPPAGRLANAAVSYLRYLGASVVPARLEAFYPYPVHGIAGWKVGLACVALAALGWGAWRTRRRLPFLAAGWLWYLVALAPVVGIVQTGQQAWADRYSYLPLIGPAIALAWLLAGLATGPRRRIALVAGAALAIGALAAGTRAQIATWRSDDALYARCLAVDPGNWLAHNNLATGLAGAGRTQEAAFHYQEALRLNPGYETAHYNYANALVAQGRVDEALAHYREAVRIDPGYEIAHYNFANTLLARGRADEAVAEYRAAIRAKPDYVEAYDNLGVALLRQGKIEEALQAYRTVLALKPDLAAAHNNLGGALLRQGKRQEALAHLETAVRLDPGLFRARVNLGQALGELGRWDEAVVQLEAAVRLNPADAFARFQLESAGRARRRAN
jgi:tetratricopeptide (TPR) repeat protein